MPAGNEAVYHNGQNIPRSTALLLLNSLPDWQDVNDIVQCPLGGPCP